MVGYPRVVGGRFPGVGVYGEEVDGEEVEGYVAGYVAGAEAAAQADVGRHHHGRGGRGALLLPKQHKPQIHSPPWRPMMAPGTPPLGEGHVPMPLNPETFNGTWGGTTGAGAGSPSRSAGDRRNRSTEPLAASGTKSGPTAVGRLIGQPFVGTDLQQGELGFIDLETLGAGGCSTPGLASSKRSRAFGYACRPR